MSYEQKSKGSAGEGDADGDSDLLEDEHEHEHEHEHEAESELDTETEHDELNSSGEDITVHADANRLSDATTTADEGQNITVATGRQAPYVSHMVP